jgi:hypothetical protein
MLRQYVISARSVDVAYRASTPAMGSGSQFICPREQRLKDTFRSAFVQLAVGRAEDGDSPIS